MTANPARAPMPHPDDKSTATCRLEPRPGGEVAWITFEHQGRMNAMGTAMMEALRAILAQLHDRPDLRVVVMTGAGSRAFVGGAFVPELHALDPGGAQQFIVRLHELFEAVRGCPVPVIARIRGYCLGGGMDLAAACDFRVADTSAVLGMPEVKVGMPAIIEAALLPDLVGWGRTREMLITGANYSAADGRDMGFFETVCEPGDLDAEIEKKIAQILAAGPLAVRAQKELLNAWQQMPLAERIRHSIGYMARAYETGEPQRMMAPLVAKKKD